MTINTNQTYPKSKPAAPTRETAPHPITGIYLGLGSNLGDRESNLHAAIESIKSLGLSVLRASSLYETEPVGLADQAWFLNQVIEVEDDRALLGHRGAEGSARIESAADSAAESVRQAEGLLRALLKIETDLGREHSVPNGPRVIDMDLLLFGELIVGWETESSNLIVPHPRMHLRRFVLEPLCEIAPALVHPVLKKTCRQLLAAVEDDSVVCEYQ